MADLVERLTDAMGGPDDLRWFRAPGRVNLMGDHTDYAGGFVLPMAVDRECVVAARPRGDGRVVVRSLDLGNLAVVDADPPPDPSAVEPAWARLVAALVTSLATRGRPPVGIDAAASSTVPLGAGLASSAAFEVAVALALCDAAGFELPAADLALACQEAEQHARGVPCGIMDQLASVEGVAGHALLLDCESLSSSPVPVPGDLAVVVAHSGVTRSLDETPYAARRAAVDAAAARLALPSLRHATPEQVVDDPVARHVVHESARARATAWALAAGDRTALAELFAASHASLRDDFGASTPELDRLVDRLVEAGALGARLTGAGWGGCVVSLVEHAAVDRVLAAAGHDAWVCRAAEGAGRLDPSRGSRTAHS